MSDSSSPSLDPRARFWGRIAAGTAVLGVGFVVAPYIWLALGGLLGLSIAAVALLGTWMVLPALTNKAANLRLKLVKMEAATNPTETLQLEHRRQSEALETRKEGIETLSGAIRVVAETISKLEREFPDSPELAQLRSDEADLRSYEATVAEEWKACYVTLGEFAQEIRRAGRLWDAALAIAKARGMSGLSRNEWEGKMKTETSFDAIRQKLNTGLAGLNTDKMRADADRILKGKTAAKALPSGNRNAIDIEAVAPSRAAVKA